MSAKRTERGSLAASAVPALKRAVAPPHRLGPADRSTSPPLRRGEEPQSHRPHFPVATPCFRSLAHFKERSLPRREKSGSGARGRASHNLVRGATSAPRRCFHHGDRGRDLGIFATRTDRRHGPDLGDRLPKPRYRWSLIAKRVAAFAICSGAADPDTAALPDTRCAPGSREGDGVEYAGGLVCGDKLSVFFCSAE